MNNDLKLHQLTMIIGDLSGGGAQRVLTHLANGWNQKGFSICIITLGGAEEDFFDIDQTITRIKLFKTGTSNSLYQKIFNNLLRIRYLRRAIKQSCSPVVISFIGVTNILTILASIGLGKRVVVCERNDPLNQSLGFFWDIARRLFYPVASLVTINSISGLNYLRNFVPAKKLVYVQNPIIPFEVQKKVDTNIKFMLSVGRLTHQKGIDILLKAFAKFSKENSSWKLVIIGKGDLEEELKKLSIKLGIENKINWVGEINNPYEYYSTANIFILSSRYEGTSNALLEAMNSEIPAIVSDTSSGCLDYLENEKNGIIVPGNDSESLAKAMVRLASDSQLRIRLGKEARIKVANNNITQVLIEWEKIVGISKENNFNEFKDR